MKFCLVMFIMINTVNLSFSQLINTQDSKIAKPLFVLFSHNEILVKADTLKGFHDLPPKYIKSLNVEKDSIVLRKYGLAAKEGVIEFYLDDEKYPNAFDSLKKGTFKKTYHPTEQDYKNYKGRLVH